MKSIGGGLYGSSPIFSILASRMMRVSYIAFAFAFAALLGCSESSVAISNMGTNSVSYSELRTNDVLITVNGVGLRKCDVEESVGLQISLLRRSGKNSALVNDPRVKLRLAKDARDQFLSKRLLLGALEPGEVVIADNTISNTWNQLAERLEFSSVYAMTNKMAVGSFKRLAADVQTAVLIRSYIQSVAGDVVSVSESEIDEVVKRGTDLREKSLKILKQQRELADNIYKKLLDGEPFAELAKRSFTCDEDGNVGKWGEFSEKDLEGLYPGMWKSISSLPVGNFSKPLEMEDAIHIIRVANRTGFASESVFTSDSIRLTLERIVVQLPVIYEVASRDVIRYTLREEKLQKFQVDVLLPKLRKNAVVAYPCGVVSFKHKKEKK